MTATSASALLAAGPLGAASAEELQRKPVAEVAREFEAMLLAQMIGAMRRTVGDSGLLPASPERKMLDGFFDLELAKSLLADADLGLARQLDEQLDGADGDRAAAASRPLAGAGSTGASAAAYRAAERAYVAPVAGGVISSRWGVRRDPLSGGPDFHAGLDLAAPEGTPVRAAAAGEVVFAGRRGDAGSVVEIVHPDGSRTSYAHLASIAVQAGARIARGERIGTVGTSGRSTGAHLHFAVERHGRPLDPEPLLGRAAAGTRA